LSRKTRLDARAIENLRDVRNELENGEQTIMVPASARALVLDADPEHLLLLE
jgi:hypothetical protein